MNIIQRLKDWKFNLKDRFYAFKHGYNLSSTWSVDYFMSDKFSKMIKDLRKYKHGSPGFLDEDPLKYIGNFSVAFVEYAMEEIEKDNEEKDFETDIFDGFTTWQLILFRMQHCFEMTNEEKYDNEYSEEYFEQVFGKDDGTKNWFEKHSKVIKTNEKGEPLLYELETKDPDPELEKKYRNREDEIQRTIENYKNEGCDLLKEWYFNLWD